MEFKSDVIQVQSGRTDDKGDKLEPEQQPARRVLAMDTPVYTSMGSRAAGALNSALAFNGTAFEFGKNIMSQCKLCKHFDKEGWHKLLRSWQFGSVEDRMRLNQIRSHLIEQAGPSLLEAHPTPEGDDLDVEHALHALGVCRAQTEIFHDVSIVHPMGGCTDQAGPNGENLSGLFEPLNVETEKRGTQAYDVIMNMAQGKPPEK